MNKYVKYLIMAVIGAIAGYAYYYFVGCLDGSCPIRSSPNKMIIFGGIIGFLVGNIIWD